MGATNVSVNLNAAINKAMHRPITKNGEYTLYTKFGDSSSVESTQMTEAEKDAEFIEKSKSNFNSPTNIRRVFVTHNKVYVHYYCPYIVNNSPCGKYTSEVELIPVPGNKSTTLYEIASSMAEFSEINQAFKTQGGRAASTVFAEQGRKIYKTSGTMINILSSYYACNNIEELYFDWTLLMSNDLEAYLPVTHRITANRAVLNNWTHSDSYKQNYDNFMLELMCQILDLRTKEDILKKFPRLKAIGIISNLADIMKNPAVINGNGLLQNRTDTKAWLEVNSELIQRSNSIVQISFLQQQLSKPNYTFKIKDQQYKFDHDYLKDYVDKYKKAFENILRTGNAEGTIQKTEQKQKEIDETLDRLVTELVASEKKYNKQNYALSILRIAYYDEPMSVKKKAVESVSDKNTEVVKKALLG